MQNLANDYAPVAIESEASYVAVQQRYVTCVQRHDSDCVDSQLGLRQGERASVRARLPESALLAKHTMANHLEEDDEGTVPGPAIQTSVVLKFMFATAFMVATPTLLFFASMYGWLDGAP